MKRTWPLLLALLAAPVAVQSQLTFVTNADNTIAITGYTGSGGVVSIPSAINGLPVTIIGELAFSDKYGVTSVTIPGSVTTIGPDAFLGCSSLTNATLSNGVSYIGSVAFGDCYNLPNVTIPGSVTYIENQAFDGCFSLTAIQVDAQNSFYSSVDGVLFDKSQSTLIEFPNGQGGSYAVPGSVTSIGDFAFKTCIYLTNVTIADTVTNIGTNAFGDCRDLSSVRIPASVTSIGWGAFTYCLGLNSITIPAGVTNINSYAFAACTNLAGVYIQGNAPTADTTVFGTIPQFPVDTNATVYYLPGTSGWSSTFADRPALLWNPLIQAGDSSFGVRSNQFGFDITGTANIPIVVEASANLAGPVWTPLQSLTLTNGLFHFSDPEWTNYPGRFYRISSP